MAKKVVGEIKLQIPAGAANLVVAAEDPNGTRLASSDPVTLEAGSPVYLELTLANPPAATAHASTPAVTPPGFGVAGPKKQ